MDLDQASIATHCELCLEVFSRLSTLLEESDKEALGIPFSDLVDAHSRFKIWQGNSGARQAGSVRSSLEYRLREASRIRNQVIELLQDLAEALEDVYSIASGARPNRTASPASSTSDDVEESLSEIQEIFQVIPETISNLFRLSIVIQNATPRDRFSKALASRRDPFDDSFDVAHVGAKFPRLDTKQSEWLKRRLGAAITQRRHFLRYTREHREKKAKHEDERSVEPNPSIRPALESPPEGPRQALTESQSVFSGPKATSTLAPTAASTLIIAKLDEAEQMSDTGMSKTSFATSVDDGSEAHALAIPALDDLAKAGNTFECPLCWTFQSFKTQRAWRKHVFEDLKPYVCTYQTCDVQLFGDRKVWFEHEVRAHRLQWRCSLCKNKCFTSDEAFRAHMQSQHQELSSPESVEPLVQASQEVPEHFPAASCPFCSDWENHLRENNTQISEDDIIAVTARQFRNHLAQHMEQLALFAIPRGHSETEDADSADVAAGSVADLSKASEISSQSSASQPTGLDMIEHYLGIQSYDKVLELITNLDIMRITASERGKLMMMTITGEEELPKASILAALIAKGVDVNFQNDEHETCLHLAVRFADCDITEQLLQAGAGLFWMNNDGETPLHTAAKYGKVSHAKILFAYNTRVSVTEQDGSTPLHGAALNGHTEMVEFLIAVGAVVNARNEFQDTPLHFAAEFDGTDVGRILLQHGADVDARNSDGKTPLHIAAHRGSVALMGLLLDNGAYPNARNGLDETSLHIAADHVKLKEEQLYLSRMAVGRAGNNKKEISLPVSTDDIGINETLLLIRYGANINAKSGKGDTPLHVAAKYGNSSHVKLLLDLGSDIRAMNDELNTPLHHAAMARDEQILQVLLGQGPELESRNATGLTPLAFAVIYRRSTAVDLLLSKNAHPDDVDGFGQPVLHKAIQSGHQQIVQSLCFRGADPNLVDQEKIPPIILAAWLNLDGIIRILLYYGASFKVWRDAVPVAPNESARVAMRKLESILRICNLLSDADEVQKAIKEEDWRLYPDSIDELPTAQSTSKVELNLITPSPILRPWSPYLGTEKVQKAAKEENPELQDTSVDEANATRPSPHMSKTDSRLGPLSPPSGHESLPDSNRQEAGSRASSPVPSSPESSRPPSLHQDTSTSYKPTLDEDDDLRQHFKKALTYTQAPSGIQDELVSRMFSLKDRKGSQVVPQVQQNAVRVLWLNICSAQDTFLMNDEHFELLSSFRKELYDEPCLTVAKKAVTRYWESKHEVPEADDFYDSTFLTSSTKTRASTWTLGGSSDEEDEAGKEATTKPEAQGSRSLLGEALKKEIPTSEASGGNLRQVVSESKLNDEPDSVKQRDAMSRLWESIQAEPDTYIMSKEEFRTFSLFKDDLTILFDQSLAQKAAQRYWQYQLETTNERNASAHLPVTEIDWEQSVGPDGRIHYYNLSTKSWMEGGLGGGNWLRRPRILVVGRDINGTVQDGIGNLLHDCVMSYWDTDQPIIPYLLEVEARPDIFLVHGTSPEDAVISVLDDLAHHKANPIIVRPFRGHIGSSTAQRYLLHGATEVVSANAWHRDATVLHSSNPSHDDLLMCLEPHPTMPGSVVEVLRRYLTHLKKQAVEKRERPKETTLSEESATSNEPKELDKSRATKGLETYETRNTMEHAIDLDESEQEFPVPETVRERFIDLETVHGRELGEFLKHNPDKRVGDVALRVRMLGPRTLDTPEQVAGEPHIFVSCQNKATRAAVRNFFAKPEIRQDYQPSDPAMPKFKFRFEIVSEQGLTSPKQAAIPGRSKSGVTVETSSEKKLSRSERQTAVSGSSKVEVTPESSSEQSNTSMAGKENILIATGIDQSIKEGQLKELLLSYGILKIFILFKDRDTGKSNGVAVFEYADQSVTDEAVEDLNKLVLGNQIPNVRRITVAALQAVGLELGVNAMSLLSGSDTRQTERVEPLRARDEIWMCCQVACQHYNQVLVGLSNTCGGCGHNRCDSCKLVQQLLRRASDTEKQKSPGLLSRLFSWR